MSVVVLLADGLRPDTLERAIAHGRVPALARMREEGALNTVTTCFPSVTGPAYAPFIMGRFPGGVGLPGLRWFDRARTACTWPDYTRSYVGIQMPKLDDDLDPDAPTMWELVHGDALGALNVISRGLPKPRRLGGLSLGSALKAATTHFRGNVAGWLDIDRAIGAQVVRHIAREKPRFTFAAFTGVDKTSHLGGHGSALTTDALGIVDAAAAQIRADAERDGTWGDMHLWVTSDHGHSPVKQHEDLARLVESLGYRVMAHPFVFTRAPEVAVMVSGNAMAHLYRDIAQRERPWWPSSGGRWNEMAKALLSRPSVDLMILPHSPESAEVRSRERGSAMLRWTSDNVYSYSRETGDPLRIGRDLAHADRDTAYAATIETDYPDSVVQVASIAGAPRSGEIILSASRDWDLRARYEPIPHVSSHGALHREHMLVPLLTNRPPARVPQRTTDVMATAVSVLGLEASSRLDGQSFM